jgi:hypothetical protein
MRQRKGVTPFAPPPFETNRSVLEIARYSSIGAAANSYG